MHPRLRKLTLSVHLVVSVGWIGALAAYLVLDVTTATSRELEMLRAAYLGMDLMVSSIIVPLAVASFVTGLVMSIGTRWGLFRHYWVVVSMILTLIALVVLLIEASTVAHHAEVAVRATSVGELRAQGSTLVHSVGGMVILLVVLVLNVYKPRGLTRHGWRAQQARDGGLRS